MTSETFQNRSGTFDIGDDLTVHRLGFGAMRLTGSNFLGEPADIETAKAVLELAVDSGVDFVDTADAYGPGVNERLIRETLSPYPDELVITTKGGRLRDADGKWHFEGKPKYLEHALLTSLDRLDVDAIDLYQYHRPDPNVPFEDSVVRLAELRDCGLINHVGLSNVTTDQLELARDIVEIASVQNRYNVAFREHEDILKICEAADIGFIPYRPISELEPKGSVLDEIARAHSATRKQVALAWLLQHSPVTLPIPGTSNLSHLAENIRASEIDLTRSEIRKIDE